MLLKRSDETWNNVAANVILGVAVLVAIFAIGSSLWAMYLLFQLIGWGWLGIGIGSLILGVPLLVHLGRLALKWEWWQ